MIRNISTYLLAEVQTDRLTAMWICCILSSLGGLNFRIPVKKALRDSLHQFSYSANSCVLQ